MANRVSQEVVEVFYLGAGGNARVSQEVVEVLYSKEGVHVALSQIAVEVLVEVKHLDEIPFIASTTTVYPLTLAGSVAVPFIASGTTVYPLTLEAVRVEVPFIPSETEVFPIFSLYSDLTGTGPGTGGELFRIQLAPNGDTETATLATSIGATGTTLTVTGDSGFPTSGRFVVTIDDEVIYVERVSAGVYRMRLRGLSGTTAAAHTAGADVVWTDTYDMAIFSDVDVSGDFTFDDDGHTYPGWLMAFDSTQAYLGGDRYAFHVAELLGCWDPSDVGGTNKIDGPEPNAICVPNGVTDDCPSGLSNPGRLLDDVNAGDVILVRYTNPEASILELGSRSCAIQSWFGMKRVDDTDNDVTSDNPPDPPFGTGGAHVVDVLPFDATDSVHGAEEAFFNTEVITTTLAGADRFFTYGTPHYDEKGWPIGALAVRQGNRRIPYWESPTWHDFAFVYAGWAPDATYVQILINRNGLVYGPIPEVDLPGPQDIDGPDARWDDESYRSAFVFYVAIWAGQYLFVGPILNGGPAPNPGFPVTPPIPSVPTGTPGGPGTFPSPVVEGGSGGGINPPSGGEGIHLQTESIALPFADVNLGANT